jgi:ABC-2 type transport system permease protein
MEDENRSQRFARLAGLSLSARTPVSAWPGFPWRRWLDIFRQRHVIILLTQREVRARYKGTYLGYVWGFARPFLTLAIYYLFIGEILGASRLVDNFAIYVFAGLTAWTVFSEALSRSTTSLISNSGLVKKVFLPRAIFPISSIGAAGFTFLLQLTVLIVISVVFARTQSPASWYVGMLSIVLLVIFSMALGLVFSAVTVYFRDLEHLVEVVLMVLFWISPIVYSLELVRNAVSSDVLYSLYLLNPITLGVLGIQYAFWEPTTLSGFFPENLSTLLLWAISVSLVALWIADYIFSRLEGDFAQEL